MCQVFITAGDAAIPDVASFITLGDVPAPPDVSDFITAGDIPTSPRRQDSLLLGTQRFPRRRDLLQSETCLTLRILRRF